MHRLQIIKELEKLGYNKHDLVNLANDRLEFILEEERTKIESRKTEEEYFAPYIADFKKRVGEYGFESAFLMSCGGHACGCMGPCNGEPYCPCEMVSKTAKMFGCVIKKEGVGL